MGCNSNYMEANANEVESQEAAALLYYVYTSLAMAVPQRIADAKNDMYGNASCLEEFTIALCKICESFSDEQSEIIIYNAHSDIARRLAIWWERHQTADKRRRMYEEESRITASLRESAISKLTVAEKRALGL